MQVGLGLGVVVISLHFSPKLLCGVTIELTLGSFPCLAPSPYPLGVLKVPSWEEGVLQTRQPLGLEAEPYPGTTHNWISESRAQYNNNNNNNNNNNIG